MNKEYSSKNLDHLGIVSGICEKLGLKGLINKLLGTDCREKLTTGEVVQLMVTNGLGFTSKPLYLTSHYYSSKPLSKLLSREIEEEKISDDKLGRVLDKIYDYGAEKLFGMLGIAATTRFGIDSKWRHLDTTSMSVHGEYSVPDLEEAQVIEYGYSKDKRPDLKQFMVSMICSQDGGIPLLEQTLKGNTSDSNHFRKVLKSLQKEYKEGRGPEYYVVDAAMYNKETVQVLGIQTKWLSRVPASLKEVQELLSKSKPGNLKTIDANYSGQEYSSQYGGVKQRWFLIHSKKAYERELKTFRSKLSKLEVSLKKELKKISNKEYHCKEDAQQSLEEFEKKLQYHVIEEKVVNTTKKYEITGRPHKDSKYKVFYKISGKLKADEKTIEEAKNKKGKFVIATNISSTEDSELSMSACLHNYKQQQKVERGFRFLKSNEFLADSVYLKKQSRIIALSMIMCLCLMVYTLAERTLRKQIEKKNKTLANQVGKEVKNPTMRWIFQLFEGISVLYKNTDNKVKTFILNIKNIHLRILELLGPQVAKFYCA